MKEIGITGGIGSGKSTVARIFESMGFAVYYADDRAKALYQEDKVVIQSVKLLFGEDIYLADGQIDRKKLGGIVFQNSVLLKELNSIVHPATRRDFEHWSAALQDRGYSKPFLLKEAAILFEAGSHIGLEGVIDVYAPKQLRLKRVQQRDDVDQAAVLARMAHQWPDSRKMFASDFIIYNDGAHMLIPQVQQAISFFTAPI